MSSNLFGNKLALRRARRLAQCAGLLAACMLATFSAHSATINIINGNDPDIGFNDSTPATPVGGNTGTTIGQQRLQVFERAAQIWGAALQSSVSIDVYATFEPLSCNATSGVLGAAGTQWIWSDFPNAPVKGTWYSSALANKLAGADLAPPGAVFGSDPPLTQADAADIGATFNSLVGTANCLTGSGFYLGLDDNPPANLIYLLPVVLHELAHGLGFQAFTSGNTGARIENTPSIWESYLLDLATNKRWVEMTDAERATSARRPLQLAWDGKTVQSALLGATPTTSGRLSVDSRISRVQANGVLNRSAAQLTVSGGGLSSDLLIGSADFGPAVAAPISQPVVAVLDANGGSLACNTSPVSNAAQLAGKVALVNRGTCAFTEKVKNLQTAGAVAVLVADNVAGSPPPGLGGSDTTIAIPSVRITQADGASLRSALASGATVTANLVANPYRLAGADARGRALMYSPSAFASGSSVSHFDTSALPNLLMEPNASSTLKQSISSPNDLTLELLRDIGW